jgi:hypothetical protein
VPDLSKNRCYADFQLSKKEWDKLEVLCKVLRVFTIRHSPFVAFVTDYMQEPANIQQTFSSEHSPTIWQIIPSLKFLIKCWETMVVQPRFHEIGEAITEALTASRNGIARLMTPLMHTLYA